MFCERRQVEKEGKREGDEATRMLRGFSLGFGGCGLREMSLYQPMLILKAGAVS